MTRQTTTDRDHEPSNHPSRASVRIVVVALGVLVHSLVGIVVRDRATGHDRDARDGQLETEPREMLRRVVARAVTTTTTTRRDLLLSLSRPMGGRANESRAMGDAAGGKTDDDGDDDGEMTATAGRASVVVENADEETTMDVEDETDARTRERDAEALARELLLEEIELEERGGDDWDLGRAPAHLEARVGRLRRESRALERDAESIFRRTQSRARARALEMLERARRRREEAREYEARAQLLRETRRRRGDTKPIDDA